MLTRRHGSTERGEEFIVMEVVKTSEAIGKRLAARPTLRCGQNSRSLHSASADDKVKSALNSPLHLGFSA